ncbi:MAG: MotA/TolQ/ExbB proton channel family protein [Planctomycetota bacterium]|nr:MotA/TolQ/ExbB proton channel family protein [Planctomycetota bacterium]
MVILARLVGVMLRRWSLAVRLAVFALAVVAAPSPARAQAAAEPAAEATRSGAGSDLWSLFVQSFDVFTVLLIAGSLVSVAMIVSCLLEIRPSRINPRRVNERCLDLAAGARWDDLRDVAAREPAFVARVLAAALPLKGRSRQAIKEAAELAAAEEAAGHFRRIELLNLIGNLAPLIGLAGTVWGMILAFTSLGASGGQAGPADLSLGISKALFHTLLGLCLAIPSLLAFGVFRGIIDKACTQGMIVASQIVERIPGESEAGTGTPARG